MTDTATPQPLALIVDDASTVRMYHRSLVESCGWKVLEAENGMEALERVGEHDVKVMLVDVNMPVMDGYSFIAAARRDPQLGSVPAIMISTEAQLVDSDKAFSAGANHYLVKPARPDDLGRILSFVSAEVTP